MQFTEKPKNYLKNRDLLENIHLSKASYTWYIDDIPKHTKYRDYDIILCDPQNYKQSRKQLMLQKINAKLIQSDKKRTSILKDEFMYLLDEEDYQDIDNKIILFDGELNDNIIKKSKLGHHNRKLHEDGKKRVSSITQEEEDAIDTKDLVLRVFTYEHIPDDPDVKKPEKKKKISDTKVKVNFPPYKHYGFYNGEFKCVAMSHYDKNMEFNTKHGTINYILSKAFIQLCGKYASRYNIRGYSYSQDMQGQALVQLTIVGLQFNELFSDNPFSYYTSIVKNAFTMILNQEKKAQNIRDDLLVEHNQTPSWTKQLENDISRTEHWDNILENNSTESGNVTDYKDDDDRLSDDIDDDEHYNDEESTIGFDEEFENN